MKEENKSLATAIDGLVKHCKTKQGKRVARFTGGTIYMLINRQLAFNEWERNWSHIWEIEIR